MKKNYIFSILFALATLNSFSQTTIAWSTPINVATGYSNIYPRLTLMTGNKPLVTWQNSGMLKIYKSNWNGSMFTTPVAVNPSGLTPFIANWAGEEIGSSGDTAFIVFSSEPAMTGHVYAVRSIDGGITFQDTVRVDQIGMDIPRFPAVAVGPGGNPVIDYMWIDAASMILSEYKLSRSMDGGATYMPPLTPSSAAPGDVCDCCPGTITITGNREALIYRNNNSNIRDMWASYSLDNGMTFPTASDVDQTNWMIMSCPSSGPSGIISGDSLYTTFMSDASGDSRIYLSTTSVLDQQTGFIKQLYPVGTSTQNYPVIAGSGDTLGVVWQGYNGSYQDVLFTYSVAGAAGLGVTVDTITNGSSGSQFRPDLSFANGRFHVVFSDSNGNTVKYMTGDVGTVGISEIENNVLVINSNYQNGNIILNINSKDASSAKCELFNSIGQKIGEKDIQINLGQNSYTLPANYSNGIYFINVLTKNKVYKTKNLIIK